MGQVKTIANSHLKIKRKGNRNSPNLLDMVCMAGQAQKNHDIKTVAGEKNLTGYGIIKEAVVTFSNLSLTVLKKNFYVH